MKHSSPFFALLLSACTAGAPQLSSGLGPVARADGGFAADASTAIDAGVDGPPRDIEIIAWFTGQAGDDGGERAVLSVPRLSSVRAQWRWRDGGWGLSQATFEDDGGYRIRGVPAGEAMVFFPTFGAVVTTASKLDCSLVVQGRLDVARADPSVPTTFRWFANGTVPWVQGDAMGFFARETPFTSVSLPMLPPGTTNIVNTIDWHLTGNPIILGSRGDTVGAFQLRQRTAGALTYRSVIAGGTRPAPDLNGGAPELRIPFTEPPMVGVDVQLQFPVYERLLKQQRSGLAIVLSSFLVSYRRGLPRVGFVDQGNQRINAGFDLVSALGLPPGQALVDERVEWADFFPRDELVASVTTRGDVVISNGFATDTFTLLYHRRLPVSSGTLLTFDATLSPVREIRVNGVPASTPLSGVGLTPRLSWSAPAMGAPTRYGVTINDVADQSFAAVFYTTATQLDVPPLTLTAGRNYVAIVTAERGSYDPLRPNFVPPEVEFISAITDPFRP